MAEKLDKTLVLPAVDNLVCSRVDSLDLTMALNGVDQMVAWTGVLWAAMRVSVRVGLRVVAKVEPWVDSRVC